MPPRHTRTYKTSLQRRRISQTASDNNASDLQSTVSSTINTSNSDIVHTAVHDPDPNNINVLQQLNDDSFRSHLTDFTTEIRKVKQLLCSHCKENVFVTTNIRVPICNRCKRLNDRNKFSKANNMDPGPIPPELVGLTLVEQMLISQVLPCMTIVRLPKGGQFGFKGHVLNVSQDLFGFVRTLPRSVQSLDLLVLKKATDTHLPPTYFTVRRAGVLRALTWLKINNQFYRDITICDSNLADLPENGVINLHISQFQTVTDDNDGISVHASTDEHGNPAAAVDTAVAPSNTTNLIDRPLRFRSTCCHCFFHKS